MEENFNKKEEGRREYSINWSKSRLYRYLDGKTEDETLRMEIGSARRSGVTKHNFQVIIDSLPFDRSSERFQQLLKILREVWK